MGAALVAEALHSDLAIHMADILPATIQVARADGTTQALLRRGVRLPAHHEFEVSLSSDAQTGTRISLYRGEHPTVADNTFLGSLAFPPVAISGSAPLAARVKLEVSGDGILSVSMRHPLTGDLRSLELLLRSD
jgi:molecular chaperone DnaK (HSP70)